MPPRPPRFWYPPPNTQKRATLPTRFLSPAASLYGLGVRLKQRFTVPARESVPVFCVGNLTVGGAGKTPVALMVAEKLRAKGESIHFLTRGYGGAIRLPTQVANIHKAHHVGDEALLLAKFAPTWVGRDRAQSARAAIRAGATVLVMDDGFQNCDLYKDLSFLVISGEQGLGNGKLIPSGPLREPPETARARTDALIVMGSTARDDVKEFIDNCPSPVFTTTLNPNVPPSWKGNQEKPMLAFAGIGYPDKFFQTLRETSAHLAAVSDFPDHYVYKEKDAIRLLDEAARLGAQLVTTEKDAMRLASAQPDSACYTLHKQTITLPVKATLDTVENNAAFDRLLQTSLDGARTMHNYHLPGSA
ncbi:MAG: tetraacyldisaccharide 4'-kinase [Parvularculales bacterium]